MAVGTMTDQAWSLKAGMRRLWTDHVLWTRMYIVSAVAGAPVSEHLTAALDGLVGKVATPLGGVVSLMGNGDAAAVRLLRNQEDIGKAIIPFYGEDAGAKLTDLLKQHILIAVDMVGAARGGNDQKFQEEDAKWTRNAEQIADLLSGANPNWPKADVVDLLGQHLSLTKQEVTARLKQQWDADVDAFDQIFTEIITVSDVPSDGLVKPFPDRYRGATGMRQNATSLRLALSRLWADHVIWTRQYIVSASSDAPDTQTAASRLLKNQDDIGAAVASVYGDAAGDKLTELLKQHITIAVDIIDAAKKGDDARFTESNARWDKNVEEIAALLSSANPNWPHADVRDLLMQHLNLTRKEVTAHLHKKYHEDVEAFDQILTEILTVADVLATGIIKQFPDRF
jgi:hypothetical protein